MKEREGFFERRRLRKQERWRRLADSTPMWEAKMEVARESRARAKSGNPMSMDEFDRRMDEANKLRNGIDDVYMWMHEKGKMLPLLISWLPILGLANA